ncbi:MAG: KGG domain-containing protein [Polyangiales bacterium]
MSHTNSQSMVPSEHGPSRQEADGGASATRTSAAPRPKARRGFAAMSAEKQREIARKGGQASHSKGTGHEWNSEAARVAGRKGGLASHGPKDS